MIKVEERRQTARQALFLSAKVRSATHLPFDAVISDITAHGCCLSAIAPPRTLDVRVCIHPEGLEALSGIVRWIVGGRFGIEFNSPLYEPVVDHLRRMHSGRPRLRGAD
jgi:PilZ domain